MSYVEMPKISPRWSLSACWSFILLMMFRPMLSLLVSVLYARMAMGVW